MKIQYANRKIRRTCQQYLGQFSGKKGLVVASSKKDLRALHKERRLSMQYRDDKNITYFPTQTGWNAFVEFTRLIHQVEPFASRFTAADTFEAFQRAFANMLSDGLLPCSPDELVAYFPDSYRAELSSKAHRSFSSVHGLKVEGDLFLRIGHCWIGKYGSLCFDEIPETAAHQKKYALEVIGDVFDKTTTVVAGGRNVGTARRAIEESAYQWELSLSILCLLLNMTYESSFDRLWQIRILERPEYGVAPHRSFSIVDKGCDTSLERELSFRIVYLNPPFDIGREALGVWHDSLGLDIFNRLVTEAKYHDVELVGRLTNAVLYFRQAANQSTPEMQISTLWICVESFFTARSSGVMTANVNGLMAMVISSLSREHWPRNTENPEELKRALKRFYKYRSRTLHHGRRGHVSRRDVQEFSLIVCTVIVCVAHLVHQGVHSVNELSERIRIT